MPRTRKQDTYYHYCEKMDEDMPDIEDEVRDQEQEVFHFRSVERYIPEERSYE